MKNQITKKLVRNIAIFSSISIIATTGFVLSKDNRVKNIGQVQHTMETETISAREMTLEDGSIVYVVPAGYELTKDKEGNSIGVKNIVQNNAINEEEKTKTR